jgi:hypothetical protein
MTKPRLALIIAMFLTTNYAIAQQTEWADPAASFVPTKTRAEVQAELEQAKADGSYKTLHQEWVEPPTNFVSTKTRAEVRAELERAKADGSLAAKAKEYYFP